MTSRKKRFLKNLMGCGASRNDASVCDGKLYLHKTRNYPFEDVLCTNLFVIEMARDGKKNVLTNRGIARKKYKELADASVKRNAEMWREVAPTLEGVKAEANQNV